MLLFWCFVFLLTLTCSSTDTQCLRATSTGELYTVLRTPRLLTTPPPPVFYWCNVRPISTSSGPSGWRKVTENPLTRYVRSLRWLPIPAGVGFTLLAALQLRHIWRRPKGKKPVSEEDLSADWEISCYRLLPFRALSRAWGWVMNQEIPVWTRPAFYGWYAKMFGCNLSEAETEDLKVYSSLGEFFRRGLKPGARPIEQSNCVVSPADGTVLHFGPVEFDRVEQVKGVTYSLRGLLGPPMWRNGKKTDVAVSDSSCYLTRPDTQLYHCVIYLAPGDYHRFHSPANWTVTFRRHFPGELLSVNPVVAKWIPGLFNLNERAVYAGKWQYGFFSLTAVGATNVGSIRVYCDEDLHTNERRWQRNTYHDRKLGLLHYTKGSAFGEFNMGSTIVLVFEAPRGFNFNVKAGQKIRVGQPLSCVLDSFSPVTTAYGIACECIGR